VILYGMDLQGKFKVVDKGSESGTGSAAREAV
jgi:hypothetical protein